MRALSSAKGPRSTFCQFARFVLDGREHSCVERYEERAHCRVGLNAQDPVVIPVVSEHGIGASAFLNQGLNGDRESGNNSSSSFGTLAGSVMSAMMKRAM